MEHIGKARKTGEGFEINGVDFEKLIIPYCEFLPGEIMEKIPEIGEENIIFINQYPASVVYGKRVKEWNGSRYRHLRCIRLAELAELIVRTVGYEGVLSFDASKPDGTMRKLTDVSKLHNLGWHHKVEIEEGVERLYRWYRGSGAAV